MLVFIADGKLYTLGGTNLVLQIESGFAQARVREYEKQKTLAGWKNSDGGNDPYFGQSSIWGRKSGINPTQMEFKFSNISPAKDGALYYTQRNTLVTGFFKYLLKEKEEQRFFHKNGFFEHGFAYNSKENNIFMALEDEKGCVDIAVMNDEGKFERFLTDGDSRDSFPSVSQKDGCVLYMSSGIARNEQGYPVAFGPSSIFRLDQANGEAGEILADEKFDYLIPKEDKDGNLYFIRRPYTMLQSGGIKGFIKDTVMFPVRFIFAIFGFINTFINMFDRKPPKAIGPNAGGGKVNNYRTILGSFIDLADAEKYSQKGEGLALVPQSWELVRRGADGAESVISGNVHAYDLAPDGTLYYTNGYKIFRYEGAKREKMAEHTVIEKIIFIP